MFRFLLNHVLRVPRLMQRIAEQTGCTDPADLAALVQMGIDSGSLKIFSIGEGKDARLYVKNAEVDFEGKTVPRLQRSAEEVRRRAMCPDGMMGSELPQVYTDAVNYLSAQRFVPNPLILNTMRALALEGFFDPKKNQMELLMLQEFSTFGTGEYYLPMFPDFRFRIYTDSRGIASYQGGDCHRAICDFANRLPASDDDIQVFLEVIGDEYGVTEDNYKAILANPVEFIKTHKGKKPFCTLRAAEALREMKEDGCSGYILQQDQSNSGAALYGWFTGDENLCRLTNFYPSEVKQDLYRAAAQFCGEADLLPVQVRDNPLFVERGTAKTFIIPMIYGAANLSLTEGSILANAKKNKIKYLDQIGNYLPNSLETVSIGDLNERYVEVWKSMGWDLAVRVASDVAKAYETAIFGSKRVAGLTTRLRRAMMSLKAASRNANREGRILNWTSPSGCSVYNRKFFVDTEADAVTINLSNGDSRHRVEFKPIRSVSSDAAAPPNVIHSVDASVVHFLAVMAKLAGFNLAPIHDSMGTHICGARWVRRAFMDVMFKIDRQWINNGILRPNKVEVMPYDGIDLKRFEKARHFLC
jgi:DNA-directed RNA polymerase